MTIDTLKAIQLGGTTQWIRIRGADTSNPVLLLIQQGPGLPVINEARRFGHLLGLEQAFTVIYWDQRFCGRSLRRSDDRAGISLEAMTGDTVSLLDYLRNCFGAKTYVAGFSFGATIGAYAAAQRPDLVATLVAVGMDIDSAAAGAGAYDFAVAAALSLPKTPSMQLMPHVDTHEVLHRVGRVVVCEGWRFGQEPRAARAVAGAGGRSRCPDAAGARCRTARTPPGRAGGGAGSRSACGPVARAGRSAPTAP
jgi:pimeloyl-ACP methyl ester carboxylesterase